MDKLGIGRRLCQLDLGAYFSFCFEAKGLWGDWRVSSHPAKLEERSEREIDISLYIGLGNQGRALESPMFEGAKTVVLLFKTYFTTE